MLKQRPVNLNLYAFQFPITAIASILHRVAGVILFFGSFILLALLSLSLESEASFTSVLQVLENPLMGFVIWGILATLAYHFTAGIKHLLMDVGYGETLKSGQLFAKVAMSVSGFLMVLAGVWVW